MAVLRLGGPLSSVPRADGRPHRSANPELSRRATLLALGKVLLRKRAHTPGMTPSKKLQTGIASVVVVGLAAAGASLAATKLHSSKGAQRAAVGSFVAASSSTKSGAAGDHQGPGFRHNDLADAASYLGITQTALETALQSGKTLAQVADATSGKSAAGLIDALVAAEKSELVAAVKAGDLTQAQADTLAANLKAHETAEVNGTFRGGHGPGDHHGGRAHGEALAAAATYLGLSESALLTQLESGKTLAQVAEATSGKSTAGLVAALVAAEKTELAAAVKAGYLTQAQADQITTGLQARVTAMVNGQRPAHDGPDHDGGPSGFRPSAGGTHI